LAWGKEIQVEGDTQFLLSCAFMKWLTYICKLYVQTCSSP